MKLWIPERRFVQRCGVVALVGLIAAVATLLSASPASSEQSGSQLRRLPAGFLDLGDLHTCARLSTGAARCWGVGGQGRLGYGNLNDIGDNETPASAGSIDLGTGRRTVAISAGRVHTCAILDTGAVRCWGYNFDGQLGYGNTDTIGDNETPGSVGPVNLGPGRRAVAISAGGDHTCALLDNGQIRCWGYNVDGRLGYGHTNSIGDNETPGSVGTVNLGLGRTAVAISAGFMHTCAILDTGAVRCWGAATSGRLGYGNTTNIGDNEAPASAGPVSLGTGRRAVAISAAQAHTCAILDTGSVRCWGAGGNGRLGYGNTDTIGDTEAPGSVGPVSLGAGRKAVAISAGGAHTCAVLDTAVVRCWGYAGNGRLGYGNLTDVGDNETPGGVGPVDLGGGRTARAIGTGEAHTCALLDTGALRCWGLGGNGRLGYGNTDNIGDNETPGGFGPVALGGPVATKLRPALSLALTPKRDRTAPFRSTAKGKLSGFLADKATCSGKVKVTAKKGIKSIVKRPALRLGSGGCSYTAALNLTSAGRWKVTASFAGNGSLRARSSLARTFTAG